MKRRKNKGAVVAIVASLSTVSLVSVGFAAWLITAGDQASVDGSISVETVEDNRYVIYKGTTTNGVSAPSVSYFYRNSDEETTNKSINFAAPQTMNAGSAWLKSDSANNARERLTAKVTYWVANITKVTVDEQTSTTSYSDKDHGRNEQNGYALGASFSVKAGDAKTAYDKAVTDLLIESPTITDASIEIATRNNTNVKAVEDLYYTKVVLTLNFKWGKYFGSTGSGENAVTTDTNPYAFYNDGTKTADGFVTGSSGPTWGDDAKSKLTEIKAANGAEFTVQLTTAEYVSA